MSMLTVFKALAGKKEKAQKHVSSTVKVLAAGVSDGAGLSDALQAMHQGRSAAGEITINGSEFLIALGVVDSGIMPVAIINKAVGQRVDAAKRSEIAAAVAKEFVVSAVRVHDMGSLSRNAYNERVSPIANKGVPSLEQLSSVVNNSTKMAGYENTTVGTVATKASVSRNGSTVFGRGEGFVTPKADANNNDHRNSQEVVSKGPSFGRKG